MHTPQCKGMAPQGCKPREIDTHGARGCSPSRNTQAVAGHAHHISPPSNDPLAAAAAAAMLKALALSGCSRAARPLPPPSAPPPCCCFPCLVDRLRPPLALLLPAVVITGVRLGPGECAAARFAPTPCFLNWTFSHSTGSRGCCLL